MKKLFLLLILLLATATMVNAVTMPTQQYNKIYLNPFYRVSLASATNYNYTLIVNPPDKISSVTSAIISFNAQINGQSQNFTLLVNGQRCNNPDYTIATAFSTTGQTPFYFDCSNRITQAGNYTITLRSSVATGTVQGWVDLTYMNNPSGDLEVAGTEYSPGDPATMFVQLKDAFGNPVQNGGCYLDVWYPLNGSGVHPYTIQDAPMIQALGDDGIYYYDMVAPSQLGVYMLSAKCSYSYNWQWMYPENAEIYFPIRQINTGTFVGGNNSVMNSMHDGLYEKASGTNVQANYTFNLTTYGPLGNITTINLYYAGESGGTQTLTFAYYNGTAWVNLPNTLVFAATASGAPSGIDQLATNSLPLAAIRNNQTVIIRLTYSGSNQQFYNNWLALAILSSSGTIQDVKGSSEMHITNIANASLNVINSALPASVWNYTTRNLTYYNMTDTTNYTRIDNTIYAINTSINTNIDNTRNNLTTRINQLEATMIAYFNNVSLNVWNYATRTLTAFGFDNTNYTRITTEVWNATNRNLTYYNMTDTTNYTRIDQTVYAVNTSINSNIDFTRTNLTVRIDLLESTLSNLMYAINNSIITQILAVPLNVWTHTFRNLTYYPAQVDMTNYTLIAQNQYNYTSRFDSIDAGIYNLSTQLYAVNNSVITSIGNVPLNVWTYTTRNLTYYENFTQPQVDMTNYTQVAVNVWTYITRNLTYYPPQMDLTNYTAIYEGVWNYMNRNLTYYQNFTVPQVDMTNYTLINDGVSAAVWVYSTRNLTYYENFTVPQQDLTNYSRISNLTAQEVWEYTNRNLTYYAPAYVNTTEVAIAVWDYNTRNLTYYPAQMDMTNYSLIGVYVWNETNRNLTYYPAQQDLTNYSAINEGVWTYTTRNLTYYENFTQPQIDMTNYTQVAVNVWTYTTRNLTYYPEQVDLTNYSRMSNLTAEDVWTYTIRNLTYYAPAYVNETAVAIAVWNSTTRELTYYPTQVDLTNYSLINQGVWTYIDRNLTYFPPQVDLTNYSAIESGVWAYNNRSLTFYPTQIDLTNYTLINDGVWTYNNRNLTYYPTVSNLTASDVWNYANRNLTYYQVNNITATDVWTYINRTLTYYETNNITATDVWAYNNRTLTYYPSQQDLTNYSAIWTYPDRNLTYYAPAYVNETAVAQETWQYPARYTHGELITG